MLSRQLDMVKWLVGVAITVAGILALSWVLEEEGTFKRVPAMIQEDVPVKAEPPKSSILEMGRDLKKHQIGKASGLLEVEITAPNKGKVTAGSIIELEAKVTALSKLEGLKFTWILPVDGVSAAKGEQEGDLGSLEEGQSVVLRFAVESKTDLNRQVHLNVYKVVNGEPMGMMAQYNTVDQEAIEASAQTKAELLQNSASASGSTEKLIQ